MGVIHNKEVILNKGDIHNKVCPNKADMVQVTLKEMLVVMVQEHLNKEVMVQECHNKVDMVQELLVILHNKECHNKVVMVPQHLLITLMDQEVVHPLLMHLMLLIHHMVQVLQVILLNKDILHNKKYFIVLKKNKFY